MSQHDMDIANGPGATVRTDINAALQALASNNVGALAPATTFPCQWWGDTTANRLKRRNVANTAWIDMGPLDTLSYLLISGGTLTGPINDAPPPTITSATTTDIGVATSNVVLISGTNTITGLGAIAAGARRTVRFLASLLLTHNVTSLILPGAASITTAANDTAEFLSLGSGNWICLRYDLANGKALAKDFAYDRANIVGTVSQSGGIPTGAIVESGTNANGSYVKYADGTLICTSVTTYASIGITTASGGIWFAPKSAVANYPATFVAIPVTFQYFESSGAMWTSPEGVATLTQWQSCYPFAELSKTVTGVRLNRIAVGRWF